MREEKKSLLESAAGDEIDLTWAHGCLAGYSALAIIPVCVLTLTPEENCATMAQVAADLFIARHIFGCSLHLLYLLTGCRRTWARHQQWLRILAFAYYFSLPILWVYTVVAFFFTRARCRQESEFYFGAMVFCLIESIALLTIYLLFLSCLAYRGLRKR